MIKKLSLSIVVSLILSVFFMNSSSAQLTTLSREWGVNIGFSSFLGDLGGSSDIGRAFFWDVNPQVTRPAIGVIYRREIVPRFALRFNAYGSILKGDDALTDNEFRHYRNLSFRSPIVEVSVMGEFDLNRFTGPFKKRFTPYIYGGIGGFYFNPQANYNGSWVNLQPLGTEGQGLPEYPDRKKYSRVAVCLPVGGGFRYLLRNNWVLGLEMACRFTNTDYIDDVSGYYPNPDYYFLHYDAETAVEAAALSDRSDGTHPELVRIEAGRGDPTNNDTYIFGGLMTFTYHFEVTKRPKINKCYFDQKNKE